MTAQAITEMKAKMAEEYGKKVSKYVDKKEKVDLEAQKEDAKNKKRKAGESPLLKRSLSFQEGIKK